MLDGKGFHSWWATTSPTMSFHSKRISLHHFFFTKSLWDSSSENFQVCLQTHLNASLPIVLGHLFKKNVRRFLAHPLLRAAQYGPSVFKSLLATRGQAAASALVISVIYLRNLDIPNKWWNQASASNPAVTLGLGG